VKAAAIAARLAKTLSPTAATATNEFSNVSRLTISSRYRTTCTAAAAPNVTTLTKNAACTWAADGPRRTTGI
jgi:hypothetical protein